MPHIHTFQQQIIAFTLQNSDEEIKLTFSTQTPKHTVRTYWIIWPQSLGRWSSIFRVKHVEQTYLVGMFFTLRNRKKAKTVRQRIEFYSIK